MLYGFESHRSYMNTLNLINKKVLASDVVTRVRTKTLRSFSLWRYVHTFKYVWAVRACQTCVAKLHVDASHFNLAVQAIPSCSFVVRSRLISTSSRLFTRDVDIHGKDIGRAREVVNKGLESFKDHDPRMPNVKSTFNKNSWFPTHELSAEVVFRPILKTKPDTVFDGCCVPDKCLELDTSNQVHLHKRLVILNKHRNNVLSFTSDADTAWRELFHYVLMYMYGKYPQEYYYLYRNNHIYFIVCYSTNHHYYIGDLATHDVIDLLKILSECVVVDFSILKKVEGKYLIKTSNSVFSINWQVSDRLGYDLIKLHGTSPGWQEGGKHYNRYVKYFDTINSNIISKRSNIFIINTSRFFWLNM